MVELRFIKTPFGTIPMVVQSPKERMKCWIKLKDFEEELKKCLKRNFQ